MKRWIPDIICGLLMLLFAYTAFSKIFAFGKFRFALSTAPLIGKYTEVLAALIPAIELIIVALLLIPRTSKAGLMSAISLLSVFTGYLIFMVLTSANLPCSCGGVIQQLSWKQHIVFNIFFIELGIVGIYFQLRISNEKQQKDIL